MKLVDLTNKKFGRLTVLRMSKARNDRGFCDCLCECGTQKEIAARHLQSGATVSCGCQRKPDLTGRTFGRLTVIRSIGLKHAYRLWECRCVDGKIVTATTNDLNLKRVQSCGCLVTEHCQNKLSVRNRKAPGEAAMNRVWDAYTNSAKSRNLEFTLTREEFIALTQQNCHYCGCYPSKTEQVESGNGSFTYNGIDRMDNLRGYTKANSVACCKPCNRAKDVMTMDEFYDWIRRVNNHIIFNN